MSDPHAARPQKPAGPGHQPYPAAGQPYPAAGQQPYPPAGYQPGYPPACQAPTGRLMWALFLIAYLPIPFLGHLLWIVVTLVMYPSQRRHAGLAAANARNAANWALTVLVLGLVPLALGLLLVFGYQAANNLESVPGSHPVGWPAFAGLGLYLLSGPLMLVNGIRGIVGAGQGRVVAAWPTIPFLRRT